MAESDKAPKIDEASYQAGLAFAAGDGTIRDFIEKVRLGEVAFDLDALDDPRGMSYVVGFADGVLKTLRGAR